MSDLRNNRNNDPLASMSLWRVMVPVAIGLVVVGWLFYREFDPDVWSTITFDGRAVAGIALAWLFMAGREFGMSWRYRVLTDRKLSWWQSLRVTMLCEFTSAVTPTSFGGSALSMLFLHHEGLNLGRATTLMMITLMLDELFFVVSCPIIALIVPHSELFGFQKSAFTDGLTWVFWCVYALIAAWTLILFMGIIVRPRGVRHVLLWVFRFRWLRRWHESVVTLCDNMLAASADIRQRSWRWWTEAMGATVFSWVSRYLVVNALFFGFVAGADQLVVFARQFVVWVVLTVSPTPGGSGVSEWLFTEYYGDMLGSAGIALVIALFWRMISYYVYLIAGVCILPGWLRENKRRRSERRSDNSQLSNNNTCNHE